MESNNPRREKMTEGPPGWMVESRPGTNEKYIGKIDRFYYEPGTSKQYRSRSQAWARYYETEQQIVVFVPKEEETAHDPHMMEKMKDRTRRINVDEIANPVTWVLTNIKFGRWTPYIEDEKMSKNYGLKPLNLQCYGNIGLMIQEEENEDEQTKDVDVQSEDATIVEQEEHSAGQAKSKGKAVQTEDMHSGN